MSVTAKHIMTTEIIPAHEKMTVLALTQLFQKHDISGAPVVDDAGHLVGVVSTTDVLLHSDVFGESPVVESEYYKQHDDEGGETLSEDLVPEDVVNLQVRDIMSTNVLSVSVETPIEEVAKIMYTNRIHRLLVLEDSRLVGILSTMDVLRAVMERVLMPHTQLVD
jgi:CBS domain-containing protein